MNMPNKERLLASIGAIAQAWTYFSNEQNMLWLSKILQKLVIVILVFLLIIILYRVFLVFIARFDITIATYTTEEDVKQDKTDGEKSDKAQITYNYVLNNAPSFIVSNRIFGDVKHKHKKTLFITYFIWWKWWDSIVHENEKISFRRELFWLKPKNRERTKYVYKN